MQFTEKRVQAAFEEKLNELSRAVHSFPWHNKEAYGNFLAQSHYLVRHTTTFLALVAGKLGPTNFEKHKDVLKHLREETGHEEMPIRDLEAMGLSIKNYSELPETTMILQLQYYFLEHGGPAAHVGYSLMLEGLAVREGRWLMNEINRLHGKEACTFVKTHALDDVDHFAEGIRRFTGATAAEITAAIQNLTQSTKLYLGMLESIKNSVSPAETETFLKVA